MTPKLFKFAFLVFTNSLIAYGCKKTNLVSTEQESSIEFARKNILKQIESYGGIRMQKVVRGFIKPPI